MAHPSDHGGHHSAVQVAQQAAGAAIRPGQLQPRLDGVDGVQKQLLGRPGGRPAEESPHEGVLDGDPGLGEEPHRVERETGPEQHEQDEDSRGQHARQTRTSRVCEGAGRLPPL